MAKSVELLFGNANVLKIGVMDGYQSSGMIRDILTERKGDITTLGLHPLIA